MIVKGPFEITWGANTITDVEEIALDFAVDSADYNTVQGRTITIDGSMKATATITLLGTDIPALAAILPQYYVANAGVLSTGETVTSSDGAIDISAASCDSEQIYNDLDIISCGSPADVTRIVHARTQISSIEVDSKVRKVMVQFTGESEGTDGIIQFFKEGTIAVVS